MIGHYVFGDMSNEQLLDFDHSINYLRQLLEISRRRHSQITTMRKQIFQRISGYVNFALKEEI